MGMTLDEAIAHTREVADENSDCWKYCTSTKNCKMCEHEHVQLAEWLEELKNNRIALEKANGYLEVNYKLGYNKAIDDFIDACKQNPLLITFGLRERDIVRIAEQLKAGE